MTQFCEIYLQYI